MSIKEEIWRVYSFHFIQRDLFATMADKKKKNLFDEEEDDDEKEDLEE